MVSKTGRRASIAKTMFTNAGRGVQNREVASLVKEEAHRDIPKGNQSRKECLLRMVRTSKPELRVP